MDLQLDCGIFSAFGFSLCTAVQDRTISRYDALFRIIANITDGQIKFTRAAYKSLIYQSAFKSRMVGGELDATLKRALIMDIEASTINMARGGCKAIFQVRITRLTMRLVRDDLAFQFRNYFIRIRRGIELRDRILNLCFQYQD